MLLVLCGCRGAPGKDGGPRGRASCARDTCNAKTRSTCSRSGSDTIAYAKLEFRNELLFYSIDLLWGFCAVIKHRSNLFFSGNNRILSHLLRPSLKTQDKAFNLCKVMVTSHYSFLLNNALMGKHGNLFSNKCLLCSSKMPMARKIVSSGLV